MSSSDPHPSRARDNGLRRMRALRRWAVALTAAAALALSGLAWASTPHSTTDQTTTTTTGSSSSSSGSSSSDAGSSSSDSDSALSSTDQSPTVTSGGS